MTPLKADRIAPADLPALDWRAPPIAGLRQGDAAKWASAAAGTLCIALATIAALFLT